MRREEVRIRISRKTYEKLLGKIFSPNFTWALNSKNSLEGEITGKAGKNYLVGGWKD